MCLSPIILRNEQSIHFRHSVPVSPWHRKYANVDTATISVPCGKCIECVRLKQNYLVQRVQLAAIDHDLYFCTLTYKDSEIHRATINGYNYRYADIKDFQNLVNRLRRPQSGFPRNFKYLAVSEYGSVTHRPHWHIIFFVPRDESIRNLSTPGARAARFAEQQRLSKIIQSNWYRNSGSKRVPVKNFLSSFTSRGPRKPYDFHEVVPNQITRTHTEDVAFYVTKYALKIDKWYEAFDKAVYLNSEYPDYLEFKHNARPRCLISKNLGVSIHYLWHINDCFARSYEGIPMFYAPVTGQSFPMSPYLKSKYMSLEHYQMIIDRCGKPLPVDSFYDGRVYTQLEIDKKQKLAESFLQRIYTKSQDYYEIE